MDLYARTLLRNIAKVYQLPAPKSYPYQNLQNLLSQTMNQLRLNQITRDAATNILSDVLGKLVKIPVSETRASERISLIVEILNSRNMIPNTVLDIGAGTGDITTALKNYYNLPTSNIFAIDEKLPQITEVTPLTYVDDKVPLPDASIDLIIMFMVLHHIPPEIRPRILAEVARVLSPNGVVIIREHDNDGSDEFYVFLDMLHIFWYLAHNETSDPLYLMSRDSTQKLFQQAGLMSSYYTAYNEPNPQRIYHEVYIKRNLPYRFSDTAAQLTMQKYIDNIRTAPHTYESFTDLIPAKLQPEMTQKYHITMITDMHAIWGNIVKEFALAMILKAVTYSSISNDTYLITSAAVDSAYLDLI
jgi:ubiquinone/menaquinone biosynthesis C-methylase UbiE